MDKNILYNLPLPGFMSGFMSLFSLFLPRRNDSAYMRQTTDDYLRESWQTVGDDLRQAMREYDNLSTATK